MEGVAECHISEGEKSIKDSVEKSMVCREVGEYIFLKTWL